MNKNNKSQDIKESYGVISIIFVYTVWGIQSLYWKCFQQVPPMQILAHRIIWSLVLLIIVVVHTGKQKQLFSVFMTKKKVLYITACAILIGSNWLLNIYAAYSNQVIEASLGHYITPIMVICLGIFILKDNVKVHEIVALVIALIGVGIITINSGQIPLIAVFLILTFAFYTFLKKIIGIDSVVGITAEVLILSPFALIYLIYMESMGNGAIFASSISNIVLLISTGIFTAVPLAMFSYGVQLIKLTKVGFIQYYSPTLNLLVGIFVFKEPFTKIHLISFSFIWAAVIIILLYPIIKKINTIIGNYIKGTKYLDEQKS